MEKNTYTTIFDSLKRLAAMYITDLKFASAEKVSLLMGAIALISLVAVLGLLAIIFVSLGLVQLLESVLPAYCSYLIIGALFLIAIALLVIFRRKFIEDPIARFISRLFLDAPDNGNNQIQK